MKKRTNAVAVTLVLFFAIPAAMPLAKDISAGDSHEIQLSATGTLPSSLNSDPIGTMTALFAKNREMNELMSYLETAIRDKKFKDIGKIIITLRLGENSRKSDLDFLGETQKDASGNNVFINQKNLGLFLGSLVVSIKHAAFSEKERAEIVGNICSTILQSAATPTSAGLRNMATLGSEFAKGSGSGKTDKANEEYSKWVTRLVHLAYLTDPATGKFLDLKGNETFQTEYSYILARYQ